MTKPIHIGELIMMKLAIEVMVSSLTYSSTYETRNDEILHADPAVRDQAHQNFGDTVDGLNACTKDVWNPISNRIFSISTAARLFLRNHQKHMQSIETLVSAPSYVFFFWVSAQLHVSCLEICMESGQNWSHCRSKRIRCFFKSMAICRFLFGKIWCLPTCQGSRFLFLAVFETWRDP